MAWDDIKSNWQGALSDLKIRFPFVDQASVDTAPASLSSLTDHIAERHDLTQLEADEEVADWIFVVSLARVASEYSHEASD